MAGEKTEPPTTRRLEEARREGQVAVSGELAFAAILIGIALSLSTWGGSIGTTLSSAFRDYLDRATTAPVLSSEGAASMLEEAVRTMLRAIAPLLVVATLMAAGARFLQVGPLFSLRPLSRSGLNLSGGRAARFFSRHAPIDFLLALLKLGVVSFALYLVAKGALSDIGLTVRQPIEATAALTSRLLNQLTLGIGGLLLFVGFLELMVRRRRLFSSLRMSKEDVAREQRQQEGDPRHRAERKRRHREILFPRIPPSVGPESESPVDSGPRSL